MKYFKVKVKLKGRSIESFMLIRARSIGEAVVIADNRCYKSHFELCDNPASEVSPLVYFGMMEGRIVA